MLRTSRLVRRSFSLVHSRSANELPLVSVRRCGITLVGGRAGTSARAAAARRGGMSAFAGEKALGEDSGASVCDGEGSLSKVSGLPVIRGVGGKRLEGVLGDTLAYLLRRE